MLRATRVVILATLDIVSLGLPYVAVRISRQEFMNIQCKLLYVVYKYWCS